MRQSTFTPRLMRKAGIPTQVRLRVVISMGKVEIAVQAAWQFADGVGVGGGWQPSMQSWKQESLP